MVTDEVIDERQGIMTYRGAETTWLVGLLVLGGVAVLTGLVGFWVWFLGALALGFLTGFFVSAADEIKDTNAFLSFLSGGVIVPVLGGVAQLFKEPTETTETLTYSGELMTKKVVATKTISVLPEPFSSFTPLLMVGGFFFAYSFAAICGIKVGAGRRSANAGLKTVA